MDKTFPSIELPDVTEDQRSEVKRLVADNKRARAYGYRYLTGMLVLGKHVYGGTVAPAEKARRRAANKVARKSRRVNRAG